MSTKNQEIWELQEIDRTLTTANNLLIQTIIPSLEHYNAQLEAICTASSFWTELIRSVSKPEDAERLSVSFEVPVPKTMQLLDSVLPQSAVAAASCLALPQLLTQLEGAGQSVGSKMELPHLESLRSNEN